MSRLHLFFFCDRLVLIEYVTQTYLELPAFIVIQIAGETLSRIFFVTVLIHGEDRSVVFIPARISKNSSSIGYGHIFVHSPFAVQQITYIQNVQAELQRVLCSAYFHRKVAAPTEIKAMYPRSACCIGFGIFAFMFLEIGILIYEFPESICVFGACEFNLIFGLGDKLEFVPRSSAISL